MKTNIINTITRNVLLGLLVFATLLALTTNHKAAAQTGSANNPIPIKGNELKGDLFGSDEEYFFSFVAEPGEIGFSVEVKATSANAGITLELTDSSGKSLAPVMLVQGLNQGRDTAQRKAQIATQQTILIRIKDIRYYTPSCRGTFVLRLSGALSGTMRADTGQASGPLGPSTGAPGQPAGALGQAQGGGQTPAPKDYPYLPQTTDARQPTRITQNSFSGELAGTGNIFYYSFAANPGDLTLTLGVIAEADQTDVSVDLLDASQNPLLANLQVRGTNQGASESRSLRLSQRQLVTLRIKDSTGGKGLFLVALDGALDSGQIDGGPLPGPTEQGPVAGGRIDERGNRPSGRSQFQITFGTRKHGNITLNFELKDELIKRLLTKGKEFRRQP